MSSSGFLCGFDFNVVLKTIIDNILITPIVKKMKKIVVVVPFVMAVLLLSQCRKPVLQDFNKDVYQEVTFTTGDSDEKGSLKPNGANALRYEWTNTDKLYVYGIRNNGTGVGFAGILNEITLYEDNHKAKFHGYVIIPAGSEKLRFVHYGTGVTVNSDKSAISDLSNQDGKLYDSESSISSKMMAYIDMTVNENSGIYDCGDQKLNICYAIMKLDLSPFWSYERPVNVSGIESNGVKINSKGEIENIAGTFSTLTGVSASTTDYYVAFAPKSTPTDIVFSNAKISGKIQTGIIKENSYYTGNNEGDAIAFSTTKIIPDGVLPGIFTVAPGKTVRFSRGNLKYVTKSSSWTFESEQYNYPIVYDKNWIGHFYWCKDESNARAEDASSVIHSTTDIIFTNSTLDTPNPSFTVNGVTGEFRCLSIGANSEFDYLINKRTVKDEEGNEVYSYGYGTVEGYKGFFILPDNWDGSLRNEFYYGVHVNDNVIDYTHNIFSSTTTPTWEQMEEAGVVFLPAAGYNGRDPGYVVNHGTSGHYWMSSCYSDGARTYGFFYNEGAGNTAFVEKKIVPYAMRLVWDND